MGGETEVAALAGTSYEEEDEDMQDDLEPDPEPALTQAEREKRKERLHERMKVAVIRVVENEGMESYNWKSVCKLTELVICSL
jgi:hypothetical protein